MNEKLNIAHFLIILKPKLYSGILDISFTVLLEIVFYIFFQEVQGFESTYKIFIQKLKLFLYGPPK